MYFARNENRNAGENHTYLVHVFLNRISYNIVHFPPFPRGSNKSKLHLPAGLVDKFYIFSLFCYNIILL